MYKGPIKIFNITCKYTRTRKDHTSPLQDFYCSADLSSTASNTETISITSLCIVLIQS